MNHDHLSAPIGNSIDTMSSDSTLCLLQRYAYDTAKSGNGTVVEIGAYRGASTIALAKGIREAGHGLVTSIDPHISAIGVYGGHFSPEDHQLYLNNLTTFGVARWVNHICTDSRSAANSWTAPIDLLWVDGDHSYDGVSSDVALWIPFVKDQGVVIFDDVVPASEVEAAIRDHLPFSHFRLIEQVGNVQVFQKQSHPRTLYLCGGMQSGGSTLVSWCFLQRQDLDGIYDMDNALIHQDFARVTTKAVWLKMTIGSFRLSELVALYRAQGWLVKPLLVQRDLLSVYRSLRRKPYGFDGATGDEPPIFVRIQRYLADLDIARIEGWPVLRYDDLILNPIEELKRITNLLGFYWDESMVTWPKSESSIAYMDNGNPTLQSIKQGSTNLVTAIASYREREGNGEPPGKLDYLEEMVKTIDSSTVVKSNPPDKYALPPMFLPTVRLWGTRRQVLNREFQDMNQRLKTTEYELHRVLNHIFFGKLLRVWKRFINKSFPARE